MFSLEGFRAADNDDRQDIFMQESGDLLLINLAAIKLMLTISKMI